MNRSLRLAGYLSPGPSVPLKRAAAGWCVTARLASRATSALCARGLIKSCAQALSELKRIVVRPEMHENQPGLLGQHVAMNCRHFDATLSERFDNRIDFSSNQHEVAGNGGLAAAGRLEVDCRRYSHRTGRSNLHSILIHRIAPRYAELVDTTVCLSLRANDLIELGGIEVNGRRRRWSRRGGKGSLAFAQCCPKCGSQFHRIAVAADVHVKGGGVGAQQMVVDGSDLQTVLDQLAHHRL